MHEIIVLISSRLMRSSDDLIWNLLRVPQAGNPRELFKQIQIFPGIYPFSNLLRKTNFLSISVLLSEIATFLTKKRFSL